MNPFRKPARRALLCAALLPALLPTWAAAQNPFPSKPVRLIVSYAPGNVTDVIARIVADKLAAAWKQPVVVENRPGLGGSLGAQMAAKAEPDGHTLLLSAVAAMAINPQVYPRVGYDPLKDFVPVTGLVSTRSVLYVRNDLNIRNFDQLVQASKARPGTFNYGTPGSGTVPHLNIEMLKARTGLDAQHVPYKGATAVLTDVRGGRLHFGNESAGGAILSQVQAGNVTPVVVLAHARLPQLPGVPTLAAVLPGFDHVAPWVGVFAPAGTPDAIVDQVHGALGAVLQSRETHAKLTQLGFDVMKTTRPEFGKLVVNDVTRIGKLARELQIKVD